MPAVCGRRSQRHATNATAWQIESDAVTPSKPAGERYWERRLSIVGNNPDLLALNSASSAGVEPVAGRRGLAVALRHNSRCFAMAALFAQQRPTCGGFALPGARAQAAPV